MAAGFGQEISPLPLGKKPKDVKRAATYGPMPVSDMPNDTVFYRMPHIESAHYVTADAESSAGICFETVADAQLDPSRFVVQLPDYKGFNVYYMQVNDNYPKYFEEEFGITNCSGSFGNLIVYNPRTETASILTVAFMFYTDSVHERVFYIDKGYTIYMAEEWATDGDDGEAVSTPGYAYKAVITDDGSFSVKRIFEPKW